MDTITIQEFETYLRAVSLKNQNEANYLHDLMEEAVSMVEEVLELLNIEDYFHVSYDTSTVTMKPSEDYLTKLNITDINITKRLSWGYYAEPVLEIKIKKTRPKLNGKAIVDGTFIFNDFSILLKDKDISFDKLVLNKVDKVQKDIDEENKKDEMKFRRRVEEWKEFEKNHLTSFGLTLKDYLKLKEKDSQLPYLTNTEKQRLVNEIENL